MYWFYLFCAITCEMIGTVSLKQSSVSGGYFWAFMVLLFYSMSFIFLRFAIKKLDIGIAYAIWSRLGTVAIVAIGYFVFQESMNFSKFIAIGFIIL